MLDKILCVDDDPITLMLCKKVVERVGFAKEIITAKHGLEAIEYFDNLFEESKVNDSIVYPKLVLLDLNMPKLNGIEFLRIIKKDDILKYIPAIVLTTSNNHSDILECYKIGIAGYVLKPLKYEEYVDRIGKLLAYWTNNELIIQ